MILAQPGKSLSALTVWRLNELGRLPRYQFRAILGHNASAVLHISEHHGTILIYMNAARSGNEALCICTISDSLVTHEETTAEQREKTFTDMMEIAFEII